MLEELTRFRVVFGQANGACQTRQILGERLFVACLEAQTLIFTRSRYGIPNL